MLMSLFSGTTLTEGAVVERLRRDPRLRLDPDVMHAGFVYEQQGSAALAAICREYFAVARSARLPILACSPSWRATAERVAAAGLADRDVNGDGVRFVRRLAAESGARVAVGGLMGCRGDAYLPGEALGEAEAAEFHEAQVEALAAARPDLLFAATLPALSEARGMARAMASSGLPYVLSFVITPEGELLDGTPLTDAIASIDASVRPAPAGYFVNCVHSSVLVRALERVRPERLIGFQANTSRKPPAEREGLAELDTEDPDAFAAGMMELHERFGLHVLGGCCGTDARHIRALAERITGAPRPHVP
jgi:homocysteine S-methyltransferase